MWFLKNIFKEYKSKLLLESAKDGNIKKAKKLIKKGADVNAESLYGSSALDLAVENEHLEIVEMLITNGAAVNAKTSACPSGVLQLAVYKGNQGIAKALIGNGANVNAINNDENTPLIDACEKGNLEIVEMLIANGADVNAINKNDGNTPLIDACERGNLEIIKMLIASGADVNAINNEGSTPLIDTCERGNLEIVKMLIANGADATPLLRLTELPAAYYVGGVKLVEQGQLDKAIEKLLTAVSLDSDSTDPYLLLAKVYTQKGLYNEAISQYQRALEIDPENKEIKNAKEDVEKTRAISEKDKAKEIHRQTKQKRLLMGISVATFFIGLVTLPIIYNLFQLNPKDNNRDVEVIIEKKTPINHELPESNVEEAPVTNEFEEGDIKVKRLTIVEQYNKGCDYERNGNYKEAIKWHRKAAEQGHVKAQFNIGLMYFIGQGVELDYEEAFKWYLKAAEQGHIRAQFYVDLIYCKGQEVGRDYEKAFKWCRKAAEQGHVKAQFYLGYMYSIGQGVERDFKEAFKWYQKASELGNIQAQINLGYMYSKGQGVELDYKEALKWYQKAAEQGYSQEQNILGFCYEKGQGVAKDHKMARNMYNKAAEQGIIYAVNALMRLE